LPFDARVVEATARLCGTNLNALRLIRHAAPDSAWNDATEMAHPKNIDGTEAPVVALDLYATYLITPL